MDTECSDAKSSSSLRNSWLNLTTPCLFKAAGQRHGLGSHDLQSENVLLLVIFQTVSPVITNAIRTFVQWALVSPTYCLLQLLQEIRSTCISKIDLVQDTCVALPHDATGLSAVCDCGIF